MGQVHCGICEMGLLAWIQVNIAIAWNALLLVAGIIEFIISIVSAAMCCSALCGGKSAVVRNEPRNLLAYPTFNKSL